MNRFFLFGIFLFILDLYVFKGLSLLINTISNPINISLKVFYWLINFFILFKTLNIFSNFQNDKVKSTEAFRFWSGLIVIFFMAKFGFI